MSWLFYGNKEMCKKVWFKCKVVVLLISFYAVFVVIIAVVPIATSYDWCIAVASENYWDQSLLFADPRKCCSVYHPLSPSKIFLRCRTTLKIRICFFTRLNFSGIFLIWIFPWWYKTEAELTAWNKKIQDKKCQF